MCQRYMIVGWFCLMVGYVNGPGSLFAAGAPHKAVFTFGGLNERSGVLFVARDAGIFRKHGLDATVVNVRNAQVGMSALAGGKPSSMSARRPVRRLELWRAGSIWRLSPA